MAQNLNLSLYAIIALRFVRNSKILILFKIKYLESILIVYLESILIVYTLSIAYS